MIGVICNRKASDAALCESLEKHFPNLRIIQYQIPFKFWFSWILRRIKKTSFMTLIGHLLLSLLLRLQRAYEKINGKSLWLTYGHQRPSWKKVKSQKTRCWSEKKLMKNLQGVDSIILLDTFRLSHQFYRKMKIPFLQIIWGIAPKYMGDSAGFWAYTQNDRAHAGTTIIKRGSQFNSFEIIAKIPIKTDQKETIRTLKIKQVIALTKTLPEILKTYFIKQKTIKQNKPVNTFCRSFYAPTFFTYLHYLKNRKLEGLPNYSHIQEKCKIIEQK